jgi:PAS domain S-box-containing protein
MADELSRAWPVHKLADFLAAVSDCHDEHAALVAAVEQAAETFDADIAAVVSGGDVQASTGLRMTPDVAATMVDATTGSRVIGVRGMGDRATIAVQFDDRHLVLARRLSKAFSAEEEAFLRSVGRVMSLSLQTLRLLESLRNREESIGAVIRSALDCIVSIDTDGRIIEWNPAAEQTFGYTRAEAVGAPMSDLIVPEHLRAAHAAGLARYLKTKQGPVIDRRIEITAIRRDGTEFPVELTVTAVPGEPPTFTAYLRDISERLAASERIQETSRRMAALIENLNEAVLVEDEDRLVAVANVRFAREFADDAPPDTLVGTDCASVVRRASALMCDPQAFLARTDDIYRAGLPVFGEEIAFADGRVFERDHIPIMAGEQATGRLWVFREVTARIESERQLEEARDNALAASRLKSSFLATMSHEIRTPMNGVVGLVDLLLESPLNPDQRDLVRMLDQSSDHLLDVIDDILDFSRIEAGELRLENVPFVPAMTVRDVVELFTPRARAAGLELRQSIAPELEGRFVSDPARIRQVLQNLVGNAIKFTPEGGVDVRAAFEPASLDGQVMLRVSVADTGIGIPAEVASGLFEPFVQADASTSRLYGGSGLGLSICQRLVALLGGEIFVASEPGAGSTFGFRIPLVPAGTGPEPPALQSHRVCDEHTPATVLVVEDNRVNQVVVRRQLDQLGMIAVTVDSAVQAIELLGAGSDFDVVLMDCQMPGMDGFAATHAIRELEPPAQAQIPIVAMTANALKEDRDACIAAGMNDYLAKPVRLDDLKRTLDRWVAATRTAAASPSPETAPDDDAPPIVDRALLAGLVEDLGGDPAVIGEFAGIFLRELPSRRDALIAALAGDDRRQLRERAHALRSPSRALGLARLDHVCERIERAALNGDIDAARALEGELLAASRLTESALHEFVA